LGSEICGKSIENSATKMLLVAQAPPNSQFDLTQQVECTHA